MNSSARLSLRRRRHSQRDARLSGRRSSQRGRGWRSRRGTVSVAATLALARVVAHGLVADAEAADGEAKARVSSAGTRSGLSAALQDAGAPTAIAMHPALAAAAVSAAAFAAAAAAAATAPNATTNAAAAIPVAACAMPSH